MGAAQVRGACRARGAVDLDLLVLREIERQDRDVDRCHAFAVGEVNDGMPERVDGRDQPGLRGGRSEVGIDHSDLLGEQQQLALWCAHAWPRIMAITLR